MSRCSSHKSWCFVSFLIARCTTSHHFVNAFEKRHREGWNNSAYGSVYNSAAHYIQGLLFTTSLLTVSSILYKTCSKHPAAHNFLMSWHKARNGIVSVINQSDTGCVDWVSAAVINRVSQWGKAGGVCVKHLMCSKTLAQLTGKTCCAFRRDQIPFGNYLHSA